MGPIVSPKIFLKTVTDILMYRDIVNCNND